MCVYSKHPFTLRHSFTKTFNVAETTAGRNWGLLWVIIVRRGTDIDDFKVRTPAKSGL